MSKAPRKLCRLDELEDGESRGFPAPPGDFVGLFVVRQGKRVFAYVNSCPHIGVPLDWTPDEFLDAQGTHIQCSTHGALFRIEDGYCTKGPCTGETLTALGVELREGEAGVEVWVTA